MRNNNPLAIGVHFMPILRLDALLRGFMLVCILALLVSACGNSEPPLGPGAQDFKNYSRQMLLDLAGKLVEPTAQRDENQLNAILAKNLICTTTQQALYCDALVLDRDAIKLARYPRMTASFDFADYKLARSVLDKKKIGQAVYYKPNGDKIWVIAAPLIHQEKIVGLLAVWVPQSEAVKKFDLTEKDFLSIDFNR